MMKTPLAPTILGLSLCLSIPNAFGHVPGRLTLLSANLDVMASRIVVGGANLGQVSAVTLGRNALNLVVVGPDEIQAELPAGTVPGTYLLLVSSGSDPSQNDEMWFTLAPGACAVASTAAALPSTQPSLATTKDASTATPFSAIKLGLDNFSTFADGGSVYFGNAAGVNTGYWMGVQRAPWTDSGGTYIDSLFGLGMFPTTTGDPTIGITMESQYRQSGTSPFASEFIENWKSPDGRFSRRPYQWNAQFATGLVQHSITGRVEYYSSAGVQNIIINETGALQLVGGDKQIYVGGAQIIGSGTSDVSLNFVAQNYGAFNWRNGAGNLLQLSTVPGGTTINGYLQVRPAFFSGYQRELGLSAAGTATDIPLYLSSKGAGDVGLITGQTVKQVDVLHTPSATRYLTMTGATSAGDPQIGTNAGNISFARPIKTPDPTAGQGPTWQLGTVKPGAVLADPANYVEVMIGGQLVKLLKAQ